MSLRNAHVVTAIMTAVLASLPANATWSIVLADTETGEVGIGQATCVGNIDLRSESAVVVSGRGVGTVQAYVDVSGLARSTIRSGSSSTSSGAVPAARRVTISRRARRPAS